MAEAQGSVRVASVGRKIVSTDELFVLSATIEAIISASRNFEVTQWQGQMIDVLTVEELGLLNDEAVTDEAIGVFGRRVLDGVEKKALPSHGQFEVERLVMGRYGAYLAVRDDVQGSLQSGRDLARRRLQRCLGQRVPDRKPTTYLAWLVRAEYTGNGGNQRYIHARTWIQEQFRDMLLPEMIEAEELTVGFHDGVEIDVSHPPITDEVRQKIEDKRLQRSVRELQPMD